MGYYTIIATLIAGFLMLPALVFDGEPKVLFYGVGGLVWLIIFIWGLVSEAEERERTKDLGRGGSTWEGRHSNDPDLKRFRSFVKDLEKQEWWRNRNR
jgi:hypothetical protein